MTHYGSLLSEFTLRYSNYSTEWGPKGKNGQYVTLNDFDKTTAERIQSLINIYLKPPLFWSCKSQNPLTPNIYRVVINNIATVEKQLNAVTLNRLPETQVEYATKLINSHLKCILIDQRWEWIKLVKKQIEKSLDFVFGNSYLNSFRELTITWDEQKNSYVANITVADISIKRLSDTSPTSKVEKRFITANAITNIIKKLEQYRSLWDMTGEYLKLENYSSPKQNALLQGYYEHYQQKKQCDCEILTADGRFHVHSAVLDALGGKIIHDMLKNAMHRSINFPDHSSTTIKDFLEFLYLGSKSFSELHLPKENLYKLLLFASNYQIEALIACCTKMIFAHATYSDLPTLQDLAAICNNQHLIECCTSFSSSKLGQCLMYMDYGAIIEDPQLFWSAYRQAILPHISKEKEDLIFSAEIKWVVESMRQFFLLHFENKQDCTLGAIYNFNQGYHTVENIVSFQLIPTGSEDIIPDPLASACSYLNYEELVKPALTTLAANCGASCTFSNNLVNRKLKSDELLVKSANMWEFNFQWKCSDKLIYATPDIPIPEQPDMSQLLYDYYNEQKWCDFLVKAADGEIFVHSSILLINGNEVIRKMLEMPMKEALHQTIAFPEYSLDTIKDFLNFIYLGQTRFLEIQKGNILELYHFARTYQIKSLIFCCADAILGTITEENFETISESLFVSL